MDVHSPYYNFRESLLKDFVTISLTEDLKQLENCMKHKVPNIFFTSIYSAALFSPKEYDSIISDNIIIANQKIKLIV